MNLLSTTFLLSEFIAFSRKRRKHSLFSCTFQASKWHIRHAMCVPYSLHYPRLEPLKKKKKKKKKKKSSRLDLAQTLET